MVEGEAHMDDVSSSKFIAKCSRFFSFKLRGMREHQTVSRSLELSSRPNYNRLSVLQWFVFYLLNKQARYRNLF